MSAASGTYDEKWGPGRDEPSPYGRALDPEEAYAAWLLDELERERRRTEGRAA